MKYKILILVSFLSVGLFAQTPLSLEEAIAKGLKNNYSVLSINKQQNVSELNNSWGKAGALPTLDLRGGYKYSMDDDKVEKVNTGSLTAGIDLNWVLFSGFSIRINKNKLDALNELSKGNAAVVMENTIQSIIVAYYRSLLEQEKLNVSKKLFNLSKDRYEKIELQKELGSTGTYEHLQSKNSFLQDKSNMLLQSAALNNSLRELNLLMGEQSEVQYTLVSKLKPVYNVYQLSVLLDKMMSSNNVLKNQYLSLKMNEMDIQMAKSAYYPRLSLTSGASYLDNKNDYENRGVIDYERTSLSAGLNLTYRLFDGGNKRRAVKIAKLQKDIGDSEKDEMEFKLSNRLASALEMYNVRKEMYVLAEENLKAAELNLSISKEKYKTGAINSFNYRDIQILYMNVAIARLNSIYNLINANTTLIKLTGGLIGE